MSIGINDKTGKKEVKFDVSDQGDFEPATPLFDGPLRDQEFELATIFWLCALLGRMFHYTGKKGDNWEIALFLIGAPSSFKSSIIVILTSYFQACQVGVIAANVEPMFPIDGLLGALIALMTECASCTLDRDLFKQMASGDPVRVNGKHKTAINVPEWIIPLLFGGNSFLNMPDMDGSVERRSAVFPFTFMLRDGEGATDLASRIFATEGPLLLIKWNTLYLKMRDVITTRIQSLLPAQVRNATHQCIMAKDTFKSFLAHNFIVTESSEDRIPWMDVWSSYVRWCKSIGRASYTVDPMNVEEQAMFKRMGVRLSRTSPMSLVRIRLRTSDDPLFRNAFEVRDIRRGRQNEEESSNSGASSEQEEDDE
jgi:phage/plasmid-associated DNA primase